MLDNNLKAQLQAYLERLQRPVELVASLDDSQGARELKELLLEIRELSDKITVVEHNDAEVRKPSFLITNPGVDSGVRFAGVPWAMNSPRWCWPCCRSAAIRPRNRPSCWSRCATSTCRCTSRPTTRCPATTARTWCRR